MDKNLLTELLTLLPPKLTSIVDLGCGDGSYLEAITRAVPTLRYSLAVDIFEQSSSTPHLQTDMTSIAPLLRNYECCLLLDTIEHVYKYQGHQLLRDLQTHVPLIIVFTPHGFYPQKGDHPYQQHISGWDLTDFQDWDTRLITHIGLAPESILAVWRKP